MEANNLNIESYATAYVSIEDIFQFDDNKKKQLILIEGEVGTGKTTLSHKVCKEWALGNMLKEFTHVVLIHMGNQKPGDIFLQEHLFADSTSPQAVQIELAANPKYKVLFWLEGWNEIHKSYKKQSVFTQLLTDYAFPHSVVVVTTRTSGVLSLKDYNFSRKYKLKGFSESQIEAYAYSNFSKYTHKKNSLALFLEQLHSVHGLVQLVEVPLNLSICMKLFLKEFKFPSTLTEVYYNIVCGIIQCYKEQKYGDTIEIKDLNDLPMEMQITLNDLEKYAFYCTLMNEVCDQKQVPFDISQSPRKQFQDCDGMGLLELNAFPHQVYHFRYRIIQEFLTAIYLTRLESTYVKQQLIRIFDDIDYEMVWIFYAGISKMRSLSIKELLPNIYKSGQSILMLPVKTHNQLIDNWQQCHNHFHRIIQCKMIGLDFLLTLMLCCFEAKNPTVCRDVADHFYPNSICHIEIPPNQTSSYRLSAVFYFIAHSGRKWSLCCNSKISSDIEQLLENSTLSPMPHAENTGSLWVLCCVVTSSEVEKYIELIKMHPSLQWICMLNGSYLGDDGISKLSHFIATFDSEIIKIEFDDCKIGSTGLKCISDMLTYNNKIVYISLRNNFYSGKDVKNLLLSIKCNISLEYLIIDQVYSVEIDITAILNEINTVRKHKGEKMLHLHHQSMHMSGILFADERFLSAQLPAGNPKYVGNIETALFDNTGGIFDSNCHKVSVIIPSGAIPTGVTAELKFAATLVAPVKIESDFVPVSAIVWLCMDVVLQKPIKLYLPHFVSVDSLLHAKNLHFAKATHASGDYMNVVDGGQFLIGEAFGLIEINHFCYYCIVNNTKVEDIPDNKYKIIVMKYEKPKTDHWKCDVCILPSLPTCIKALVDQYDKDFIHDEEGSDFSFASLTNENHPKNACSKVLRLSIDQNQFGEANVRILSPYTMISKEKIDFQHCYKNDSLLEELKLNMEKMWYPPRFRIELVQTKKSFFQNRQYLRFNLDGAELEFCRDVAIPSVTSTDFDTPSNGNSPSWIGNTTDHLDKYCHKPSHQILRRLNILMTPHWKDLGYELIQPEDINVIDSSKQTEKDKCFAMLIKWLESDVDPCYCKIIKALQIYKCASLVYELKLQIRTCP